MFFAEFLAATGVFERWVSRCPLAYRSGNAPDKRDVLGTLMLGLLAGHRRYAHITALRGDAVAWRQRVQPGVELRLPAGVGPGDGGASRGVDQGFCRWAHR